VRNRLVCRKARWGRGSRAFASSVMPELCREWGQGPHFMLLQRIRAIPNYGTTLMTQPARVADEPEFVAPAVWSTGFLQGLKANAARSRRGDKGVFFKQVRRLALLAQARETDPASAMGILMYGRHAATKSSGRTGSATWSLRITRRWTDLVMKYLAPLKANPRPRNLQRDDQPLLPARRAVQAVPGRMGRSAERERTRIPPLRELIFSRRGRRP